MPRTLLLSASSALLLCSCGSWQDPIGDASFDPLSAPGSNATRPAASSGPGLRAGEFVNAAMSNTAFFRNRPKGDADADKLLPAGTSMKVVSQSDGYVKVELDSGEIGFVPSVMVETPGSSAPGPLTTNPGEIQVYPPLNAPAGSIIPLPPADPSGQPPAGAIPTVIDPEAPVAPVTPLPTPTTPTESFAVPVAPPATPPTSPAATTPGSNPLPPLPPNQAELDAKKEGESSPPAQADPPVPADP